jgi:DMSO/TMAO reductase YedYZ heme-binding membrane subunit
MPETAERTGRRSTVPVVALVAAALLVAAACVLLLHAPDALAATKAPGTPAPPSARPIPGSPLDAYDHHMAYDRASHKLARLFAFIAYALMVATVVLGVILRLRFMQRAVNRATFYGAHMTLALSAVIFGAVHGVTFVYQPVWDIGWYEYTVPFTSHVQRLPVGFGVLGTELAVAVACSVWLQRRLGYHRWLRVHQFAYVCFGLVWLHIFLVHPEPRHLNLVAVAIAAGAGTTLLAFLIRALPSRSRLRQRAFPGGSGVAE